MLIVHGQIGVARGLLHWIITTGLGRRRLTQVNVHGDAFRFGGLVRRSGFETMDEIFQARCSSDERRCSGFGWRRHGDALASGSVRRRRRLRRGLLQFD